MQLPKTADAVVIGGGILGASTAHFLAKLGFGQVVLVEKMTLAAVSTGHTGGAIRTAYSNPITIQLALRGLAMFANAEEHLGGDCGFRRCGYLVLAGADEVEPSRAMMRAQVEQGVEVEEIGLAEIRSRWPEIDLEPDGVAAGIFEPQSGVAEGYKTTRTLVASVGEEGLTAFEGVAATGIRTTGGKVAAVETDQGSIATPVVVNAAGGWGRRVGAWVGLNYSFRWSRETDIVLNAPFGTGHLPWISDALSRQYIRPDPPGQLCVGLGWPKEIEPLDIDDYDPEPDVAMKARLLEKFIRRLPGAAEYSYDHGWASMYTITDDWHPLVGPEPEETGYYACVAGNGHCFKLGPPLGESLAHIIAGQAPPVDLHPLRSSRFVEGEPITSVWGGGNRA